MGEKSQSFRILLQMPLVWVSILCILVSISLIDLVATTRMSELKSILTNISRRDDEFRNLTLLSRFQMIKRGSLDEEDDSDFQTEKDLYFSMNQESPSGTGSKKEFAGILLVNFFNTLMGSPQVHDFRKDRFESFFELGYYHSMRKEYVRGVEVFNQLLKQTDGDPGFESRIFLNRGFCFAVLGDNEKARKDFSLVISRNVNKNAVETAVVLNAFLTNAGTELAAIDKLQNSPQKAELYFRLGAFVPAVKTLQATSAESLSAKHIYMFGKSLEEVGAIKNATLKYREVIARYPASGWARKSNRRLFALGTFYDGGKELTAEAQEIAKSLGDRKFLKEQRDLRVHLDKLEEIKNQNSTRLIEAQKEISKAPGQIPTALVKGPQNEEKSGAETVSQTITAIVPEVNEVRELPKPSGIKQSKVEAFQTDISAIPVPEKKIVSPQRAAQAPVSPVEPVKEAPAPPSVAIESHGAKPAPIATPGFDLKNPQDAVVAARKLSRVEKRKIIESAGSKAERIFTNDGNEIWGVVFEETDSYLKIFTVAGNLSIPIQVVLKREPGG